MTIQSDITIGTLICINYILGQLSSALASMLRIPQDVQDARISLARLAEVQLKEDENTGGNTRITLKDSIDFRQGLYIILNSEGMF